MGCSKGAIAFSTIVEMELSQRKKFPACRGSRWRGRLKKNDAAPTLWLRRLFLIRSPQEPNNCQFSLQQGQLATRQAPC